MVKLGDKITFTPTAWTTGNSSVGHYVPSWMQTDKVTGTVVYINRAHRYYRVEYAVTAHFGRVWVDHECFLFPPPPAPPGEVLPPPPSRGHYSRKGYIRPIKAEDIKILEGKSTENENNSNL